MVCLVDNESLKSLLNIDEELNTISILVEINRDEYVYVDNILSRLGGKWNKRAKVHEFLINPKPLLDAYYETGNLPEKNPTAFFPTPSKLSNEVLRLSDFSENYFDDDSIKLKVLEPSGGVGGLADAIMKTSSGFVDLDIVEILEINQSILRSKGYSPICMDFMEYNSDYKVEYDYIIMNPPFSLKGDSKAYITHVMHAFNMLNSFRGTLAAIIPTGFMTNSTKKEKEFLELISQCGDIYKNPKGSFEESGTKVDTYTIVMSKSTLNWKKEKHQGYVNYHTWYGILCFLNTAEYANSYFKKVESDLFLDDAMGITTVVLEEMIIAENKQGNLISVDNIQNMAKYLLRCAAEHLDIEEIQVNSTVLKESNPSQNPVNNTQYDNAQLEAFNTGSLF